MYQNTAKRPAYLALLLACLLMALPCLAVADGGVDEDDMWTGHTASLNQRMATRSGPGTKYTEELGTMPQGTAITLLQQEMGSVPWGLVEFEYRGGLYRAYTGMKRIDTGDDVPWITDEPRLTYLRQAATPHYGPGTRYVPMDYRLDQGTPVAIYGYDDSYALVEYLYPLDLSLYARGWVPSEVLRD